MKFKEVLLQQVQNRNMVSTRSSLQQNIKLLHQKEWKVLSVHPGAFIIMCY